MVLFGQQKSLGRTKAFKYDLERILTVHAD